MYYNRNFVVIELHIISLKVGILELLQHHNPLLNRKIYRSDSLKTSESISLVGNRQAKNRAHSLGN